MKGMLRCLLILLGFTALSAQVPPKADADYLRQAYSKYRSMIDASPYRAVSGLTDTQTIARIVVHPTNPDIVYVAASGHEWTDNEMRGVFKTTDGGKNWTKVLYRSPRTGAIDLVMDPSDPDTLYAATWQRIRRKWSDPRVERGYDESGVFKTTDAGR